MTAPAGPKTKMPNEAAESIEKEIQAIRNRTDALRVEAQTFGMSVRAQEEKRIENDLLTSADQKQIARTPELLASIRQVAAAYGVQTEALERKRTAQQDAADDLQTRQRFQAASQDIGLEGAGVKTIEAARYAREKFYDIERQTAQNGPEWARQRIAGLQAEALAWGKISEAAKQAEVIRDLVFEQQQFARSEAEKTVYNRMNSAGLLDKNGQIVGAQNEAIAGAIRWQETIKDLSDAYRGLGEQAIKARMEGNPLKVYGRGLLSRTQDFAAKKTGEIMDQGLNSLLSSIPGGGALSGIFSSNGPDGSSALEATWVAIAPERGLSEARL